MMNRFFTLLLAASCLTAVGQECADDIYPPTFTGQLIIPDGLNADMFYIDVIAPTFAAVLLDGEAIIDSENPEWFMPIYEDNCTDSLELNWQQGIMSGGCLGAIYRSYSFFDSSGNQADFEVLVTLFDNVSPYLIQGPSDLTLDCSNSLYYQEALNWFESGGGIVAADAVQSFLASLEEFPFEFGPLPIVAEYDDSAILAGEPTTIEVSWRVEDQCGNMTLATSLLTLECGSNVEGCMDEMACNFNMNANSDDGSCHFLCQYCKEGTVWDEDIQGCIVANPSDSNFDGCVQLNDLLDLLSAYGNCGAEESTWQCGDPLEYQGYDYETVQIGEQCWFAENLRSENYENEEAIPADLSNSEWEETTEGAVSVYDGDMANLSAYGRLYNWYAVEDSRGLCPSGWHIPSDGEFIMLELELGMSEDETNGLGWRGTNQGIQLKSNFGWWAGGNGDDSIGFTALPGGNRLPSGGYNAVLTDGNWWTSSSSESQVGQRMERNLDYNRDNIARGNQPSNFGFSIRCIKDAE